MTLDEVQALVGAKLQPVMDELLIEHGVFVVALAGPTVVHQFGDQVVVIATVEGQDDLARLLAQAALAMHQSPPLAWKSSGE